MNELLAGGFGVFAIIIVIVYWLMIPFLGRWVAIEKGYSSASWFWLCLFFGVFALIAICGAPDKAAEAALIDIRNSFRVAAHAHSSRAGTNMKSAPATAADPAAVPPSGDTWVCKKCGERNRVTASSCKGCGKYR